MEDCDWLEEWTQGDFRAGGPEYHREVRDWLANKTPEMLDMLRRFPPHCVVRATVPLAIPAPGKLGIVTSYREIRPRGIKPRIEIAVRSEPYARNENTCVYSAYCDPDVLEVVGFWKGLDHGAVSEQITESLWLDGKTD